MSRSCLWELQPADYVLLYVYHFVGGGWLLAAFVLDGLQIPWWTLRAGRPMTTLFTRHPLAPHYTTVIAVAVACVTVTWTALFEWDDRSLSPLLGVLLGVIGCVAALGRAVLVYVPWK